MGCGYATWRWSWRRFNAGNFCIPINWTVSHEGGFGGPIMADNKVFVYAPSRDIEALAKDPDINKNPYYRLGADPGLITIKEKCLQKQND